MTDERRTMEISHRIVAKASEREVREHVPYRPPRGVIPENRRNSALAMDSIDYQFLNQAGAISYSEYHFPGYQELAAQAQLPEFRKINEEPAREMVREWIKLHGLGDDDKSDKIAQIEAALRRFNIRDLFRQAAVNDSQFGRCQLYVEVKTPSGKLASDSAEELAKPLTLTKEKIKKGSLIGFKLIEPIWTYPSEYNADQPLKEDFFKPQRWYVMGKTIHDSRLLMFRSRPVPDLLKPSYNFSGVSMTQMARPYVEHWIRTRNSVSDVVHSFSINGVKTNMQTVLQGANDPSFMLRAQLFNEMRDNKGLMLLDKESEEFFQFNIPLSGLSDLQAQSQEQMSAVSNIPLVKLLGITPTGLNASSEGEIRVYYDFIHSVQEVLFRKPLESVIKLIQLNEFGEIDEDIDFDFEPLYGMNETERAQARLAESQADTGWVSIGAVSPDEVRTRLANDPESGYEGLDVDGDDERENMLPGAEGDPDDTDPAERSKSLTVKAKVNDR